ncbi:glycosyltransferase [Pseudoalteromonas sp. MEBiC 03607]|nr:glycosyltransferase [Pseudoalteromonas sp. MEBiC 03607]
MWACSIVEEKNVIVSIYLPTKNRLPLLKRAVESVLNQTFTNFELIIVNDGSTDSAQTKSWLDELSSIEPRVRVIHQQTSIGACAARNKAINIAEGKYITGLDDDDEFLPHRLESLVSNYDPNYAFLSHGVLWFYGKKGKVIDAGGGEISLAKILSYNYATNQVFTETYKLKLIKGFDTSFKACQDYDTWTRLIKQFGPAKMLKGYSYIQHQGHEETRITTVKNKVTGYNQYIKKHHQDMSRCNKENLSFLILVAQKKRYPLSLFVKQLFCGLQVKKMRYFLSSNLPILAHFRNRLLK